MSASRLTRRDFLRGRAAPVLLAMTHQQQPAESPPSEPLLAHVDIQRCLGNVSQLCTVCVERCPNRAFSLGTRGLLPVLNANMCNGCGRCAELCPAPEPAIKLFPRQEHA